MAEISSQAPSAQGGGPQGAAESWGRQTGILGGVQRLACGVTETRSKGQRIMAFPVLPPYTKCDLAIQDRFAQLDQGGKV